MTIGQRISSSTSIFRFHKPNRLTVSLVPFSKPLSSRGRWVFLSILQFTPFAEFQSTGGSCDGGHTLMYIAHFFTLLFSRTFSELGNLGNDKPSLSFWKIGFLKVMKMRGYDVFFFVYEATVCSILGNPVNVSNEIQQGRPQSPGKPGKLRPDYHPGLPMRSLLCQLYPCLNCP